MRAISGVARPLLRRDRTRRRINRFYSGLSGHRKAIFGTFMARAFGTDEGSIEAGAWSLTFLDRPLRVPLRPETARLDWIYALSVLGHDREVVDTYETLVRAEGVPATFLDMGANYGMHSLLFAKLGARVLSFEPNPGCGEFAAGIFAYNAVQPEWHGIALGGSDGTIDLRFPEGETWMGTTDPDVADTLASNRPMTSVRVPVRRLDEVVENADIRGPVLVKIDVEGSEVVALSGGLSFIREHRPRIVFEANDSDAKRKLGSFLDSIGYVSFSLPFDPANPGVPMGGDALAEAGGTNFLAQPHS